MNTPTNPNSIAEPGSVTIDGERHFSAAHIPPTRWNGFVCPAFTREQAQAVTDWANQVAEENPESTTFVWDAANLDEINDYGDGPERTRVGTITINDQVLYCISDGWAWSISEVDE